MFRNATQVFGWCGEGPLWDDRVSGRSSEKANPNVSQCHGAEGGCKWWMAVVRRSNCVQVIEPAPSPFLALLLVSQALHLSFHLWFQRGEKTSVKGGKSWHLTSFQAFTLVHWGSSSHFSWIRYVLLTLYTETEFTHTDSNRQYLASNKLLWYDFDWTVVLCDISAANRLRSVRYFSFCICSNLSRIIEKPEITAISIFFMCSSWV